MTNQTTPYIPALRFHWLTPLYDPLLKWGMQEDRFKRQLIAQAAIKPHMKVLDLGCGTGNIDHIAGPGPSPDHTLWAGR